MRVAPRGFASREIRDHFICGMKKDGANPIAGCPPNRNCALESTGSRNKVIDNASSVAKSVQAHALWIDYTLPDQLVYAGEDILNSHIPSIWPLSRVIKSFTL